MRKLLRAVTVAIVVAIALSLASISASANGGAISTPGHSPVQPLDISWE